MRTILYPVDLYPDDTVEREIFGPDVRIVVRNVTSLMDLSDDDVAQADGLMLFRLPASAEALQRFHRLRVIVRMSVGYDAIDRVAAEQLGMMVCNVPDYGTTEVADHAIALMLALRRGIVLHHDAQRQPAPAPWSVIETPLIRRLEGQTFGVLGLGRIGIAAAMRARAFGLKVVFHDPYLPNGYDRALGFVRATSLDAVLEQTDVLSIHTPLTPKTRGMIGLRELSLLPKGAIIVNTARGPIIDIDALEAVLESGHLAGAGLDVIPTEPPVEPLPSLLAAYRDHAPWLAGRLIVTPHSAFHSPQAWDDIRRKGAEVMAANLLHGKRQNVVLPDH